MKRESNRSRDRWIWIAIALFALALRFVAVSQYEAQHPNAAHPVIDEASYDRWAREIASGDWLGQGVFFQEPLYPYSLGALYAVFGAKAIVARIAQCFAWAIAAIVVGLLTRRLFGRVAGFVAALAIALYQPGLIFPSLLLKENLFLPLFALFALLVVRTRDLDGDVAPAPELSQPLPQRSTQRSTQSPSTWRRGALAWLSIGIVGALGALLRGNMLVLLPIFAAWPLARRFFEKRALVSGVVHGACVLLGCACVLVPIGVRNWDVGHEFVLTTSGAGTNLYGGNNLENPYGRATEFSFVRGVPDHEAGDWKREAERRSGHELNAGQVSAFWRDQVFESVRAHPLEHLQILANKARATLGAYEVPDNHMLDWDARYVPIARAPWPRFGLVGALGLAGLVLFVGTRIARRTPHVACVGGAIELALLFALYYGTIVLTVTSDRARLPLVGVLAPFAGWIVVEAWRVARARNSSAILATTASLLVGFTIVYTPLFSPREIEDDFDKRDYNLAVQWSADPAKFAEASALATRLASDHPQSARLQVLLGDIAWRRASRALAVGDAAARTTAMQTLSDLLAKLEPFADDERLSPRERFRAASLAAWIHLDRGEFEAAEARFRDARRFDYEAPDLSSGEARAILALTERDTGLRVSRINAARSLLRRARAQVRDPEIEADLELLMANAEFQLGREFLSGEPQDETRQEGQSQIRSALDRAKAQSAPGAPLASRARALAGWIQIYLINGKSAENHFRAALAIPGVDRATKTNASVGLARALIQGAEKAATSAERSAKIAEARLIAEPLLRDDPTSPEVVDLVARLANL